MEATKGKKLYEGFKASIMDKVDYNSGYIWICTGNDYK